MSARDELPPGWEWQGRVAINHATGRHVSRGGSTEGNAALCWDAWRHKSGITREEYTATRAAVERCAELEVLADGRSEALDVAIGKINKAEAALANVTAERDEARSCAAEMRDSLHDAQPSIEEGPSEWMPLTWERATPTEGECSECGATSEERGLLPCDMPGCPRATPTEGA